MSRFKQDVSSGLRSERVLCFWMRGGIIVAVWGAGDENEMRGADISGHQKMPAVSVGAHPCNNVPVEILLQGKHYLSDTSSWWSSPPGSLRVLYFHCPHSACPSGNFSFSSGDTMKTATCGATCHTQQEHPARLLGKVLRWINQLLLFLNQYCETIKGSRDGRHTQKPAVEVEGPAGSFLWTYRVWFRSKENSWSGNNRTFQKNTAVPPSLPAALTLSVSWLPGCLSLGLEMFVSLCYCLSLCPYTATFCSYFSRDWHGLLRLIWRQQLTV